MSKPNLNVLVIKFLGFLHIVLGLYTVLKTTLLLRNEFSSGSGVSFMVIGYGIFSLPLILGGTGLIIFKNRARIFLIFYDLLILLALTAPIIYIFLQGPAYHKYWVELFLRASVPLLVVIYLLLPSVKRYFH